jgi:hypothetical protein
VLALPLVLVAAGCGSKSEAPRSPHGPARSAPIAFAYGTPAGEELGSAGTRGRVTALLFVTTFDLPSQLMARRLDEVVQGHRPRVNAGAVALEAPNAAPLVDVFRTTLGLGYPVALSGGPQSRDGPFGVIDRVPTLIVLDREGREVSRTHGVVDRALIEAALSAAAR